VSLEVAPGEVFGLLGPNGAGKTTMLECVVGLREPDGGEIEISGVDARTGARALKEKIGVALQATALPGRITPREALRMFGSFYRVREEPEILLKRFGLGEKADTAFDALSEGQRQRLALALALVNRPHLVFFDEPTAGLDPQARAWMRAEIARLKADGRTVFLTTHLRDEAEELCDRVAILSAGRVAAVGPPADLIAGFSEFQAVTLVTSAPVPLGHFVDLPGAENVVGVNHTVRFRTRTGIRSLAALAALLEAERVDVVDLQVRKASLEDVFLELTGGPRAGEGEQSR
jgi:ABC-2 type transport system ATP-binding protein